MMQKKNVGLTTTEEEEGAYRFEVVIRRRPGEPELLREEIKPADLTDMYSETWFSFLRRGHIDLPLEDLSMRLLPLFLKEENDNRCAGMIVEAEKANGEVAHRRFDICAVAHVANRASNLLVEWGLLEQGQRFFYEVVARHCPGPSSHTPSGEPSGSAQFKVKRAPLTYLTAPLAPFLQDARPIGLVDGWYPLLFLRGVFSRAERLARLGSTQPDIVETGAVILGVPVSCPDTGEFFIIATEAIEVADAHQTQFSLMYSSKSWARIQTVVRARQADPATRAERIVGQSHGHLFLPGFLAEGKQRCEYCQKRTTCEQDSVFVSEHDLLWSRSVFARQPWAFCLIFGLDARGDGVSRLFGFNGGRLVQRGFYLLDDSAALLIENATHHNLEIGPVGNRRK